MEITKEAVRDLYHGTQTVGTTRVQLTDLDFTVNKGVLVRCPGSSDEGGGNTKPVWIGGPAVTADVTATGGIPILPGDALFIPVEQPKLLWVISNLANQKLAWIGL